MCAQSAEQQRVGLTGRQEQGHGNHSMPSWPALRGKVVAFRRRNGVPCSSRSSKSEILVKKAKTHAPAKRLSIDVPVFVQRRFKTACRATSRQMFAELRHLIEARMLELEGEIGKPRAG